jgi:post-GPI attachment to proteins factor 3
VLLALPSLARSSVGDREPGYRACVHVCLSSEWDPPLSLRLLGWTAAADCGYFCSWNRTAARAALGQRPLQYHGKWPFHRVVGVQAGAPATTARCTGCVRC